MFNNSGGIEASCVLHAPNGSTSIDLRSLTSFAMFTASGAISDTSPTTINGDIGTGLGAFSILGTHIGEIYAAGTTLNAELIANNTTCSIYQNGTEIVNFSRTVYSINPALVSLHAIVSILSPTDIIEIHGNVNERESTIKNRNLSLMRYYI